MIITLKNIKHSEFASQETNCFEATVYVDGKRSFITSNAGHGGCDDYRPFTMEGYKAMRKQIEEIDAFLAKGEKVEYDLKNCLEFVVGDLLTEWLICKDIKKTLKKLTYTNGKDVFCLKGNVKPTPPNIVKLMASSWWSTNHKILNTMTLEEVMPYFK